MSSKGKNHKKKSSTYVPPMIVFPEIVVDLSDPKWIPRKPRKARPLHAAKRRNGASAKTKTSTRKKRVASKG